MLPLQDLHLDSCALQTMCPAKTKTKQTCFKTATAKQRAVTHRRLAVRKISRCITSSESKTAGNRPHRDVHRCALALTSKKRPPSSCNAILQGADWLPGAAAVAHATLALLRGAACLGVGPVTAAAPGRQSVQGPAGARGGQVAREPAQHVPRKTRCTHPSCADPAIGRRVRRLVAGCSEATGPNLNHSPWRVRPA